MQQSLHCLVVSGRMVGINSVVLGTHYRPYNDIHYNPLVVLGSQGYLKKNKETQIPPHNTPNNNYDVRVMNNKQ